MTKCLNCVENVPKGQRKYCTTRCRQIFNYIKSRQPNTSFHRKTSEWNRTRVGQGYKWEMFVARRFGVERQGFKAPFDILWNGKKIDVKSASLYKRKNKHGRPIASSPVGWFCFHKYCKNNNQKIIDFLFCIGIINNKPYKMWLIPYNDVGKVFTITPNPSPRFDKYLI